MPPSSARDIQPSIGISTEKQTSNSPPQSSPAEGDAELCLVLDEGNPTLTSSGVESMPVTIVADAAGSNTESVSTNQADYAVLDNPADAQESRQANSDILGDPITQWQPSQEERDQLNNEIVDFVDFNDLTRSLRLPEGFLCDISGSADPIRTDPYTLRLDNSLDLNTGRLLEETTFPSDIPQTWFSCPNRLPPVEDSTSNISNMTVEPYLAGRPAPDLSGRKRIDMRQSWPSRPRRVPPLMPTLWNDLASCTSGNILSRTARVGSTYRTGLGQSPTPHNARGLFQILQPLTQTLLGPCNSCDAQKHAMGIGSWGRAGPDLSTPTGRLGIPCQKCEVISELLTLGLEQYKRKFHAAIPLVHIPTFFLEEAPPILLLVMCLLGLSFVLTEEATGLVSKILPGLLEKVHSEVVTTIFEDVTAEIRLRVFATAALALALVMLTVADSCPESARLLYLSTLTAARQHLLFSANLWGSFDHTLSQSTAEQHDEWMSWSRVESAKRRLLEEAAGREGTEAAENAILKIKIWAQTSAARRACLHAAQSFKIVSQRRTLDDGSFHSPHHLFNAALVLGFYLLISPPVIKRRQVMGGGKELELLGDVDWKLIGNEGLVSKAAETEFAERIENKHVAFIRFGGPMALGDEPCLGGVRSAQKTLLDFAGLLDNMKKWKMGDYSRLLYEVSVPTGLFINNEFTPSVTGGTIDTINPANGKWLATVSTAHATDVDNAVASARAAFNGPWKSTSPQARAKLLLRLAQLIKKDRDDLATLASLDAGVLYHDAQHGEIEQSIEHLHYFAGWADKITGKSLPGQAAGNVLIIKTPELAPLCGQKLAQLVQEAGFPPGVINIICGLGNVAGAALAAHQDVKKIAFTGSTAAGRSILHASANSNLKKVTLELGGKGPSIVFGDADLENALRWTAMGITAHNGQICAAGSRIFVHESIYEHFCREFQKRCIDAIHGDPLLAETTKGPVISQGQLSNILQHVENGIQTGAKLLYGGKRIGKEGYFIENTAFVDVGGDSPIMQEEIFGPVAAIASFSTEDEAVAKANDTVYGLSAAIFTKSIDTAVRVTAAVESGNVTVNAWGMLSADAPFGGYKQSGFGRDGGEDALQDWTTVKTIKYWIS
ncbi:hypothetical protein CDV31_009933 [Fusarium ambrosium]|uniref:aldehyde dehydrogenase (NAD(+)) n=1 Tax=Fusarium ambrosium TaxID=131363 RepID=A0A428TRU9_9HYPO|nr:hypothetical protein CDV31_009933 [Fusarium ambrosium]